MAVGSFLGYVSWKKMDAFLRWFFRILKTDKSQSKHPKKKTQIPQDVTSKWRIPPKIPEKKSNRQPQKIRLKRMFSDHKTTDPPLELVTFTLWVQVDH